MFYAWIRPSIVDLSIVDENYPSFLNFVFKINFGRVRTARNPPPDRGLDDNDAWRIRFTSRRSDSTCSCARSRVTLLKPLLSDVRAESWKPAARSRDRPTKPHSSDCFQNRYRDLPHYPSFNVTPDRITPDNNNNNIVRPRRCNPIVFHARTSPRVNEHYWVTGVTCCCVEVPRKPPRQGA